MPLLLLQGRETIRFLAHAQRVVKNGMAGWFAFSTRVVTEFLVAEKESVTYIHKRLKNVYSINAVK
jgi:hypothetical protein